MKKEWKTPKVLELGVEKTNFDPTSSENGWRCSHGNSGGGSCCGGVGDTQPPQS